MTNKKDDLSSRKTLIDAAQEETVGVALDGNIDASGEYPKRDYFFGTSINKAAVGAKINKLTVGGSEIGVDLQLTEQGPSEYPLNQVQETESGHVIEVDDTPGGERILIKHRTGAGMELRADGSVLISSQKQKVEVTAGDHTVIVEGEGDLIYKGNVNLRVSGDFNVDVGGNYNLEVAGDKVENIKGRHSKTVNRDQNYTIRGARGEQVIGMATTTCLDDMNMIVKGAAKHFVEGDIELTSGNKLITTAVSEWVAAAGTANITARHISMIGHKGTIGGPLVDHYGKTYGGMPGGLTNVSTFYGSLVGKATESFHADYAIKSTYAGFAKGAGNAMTAIKGGGTTPGPKPTMAVPKPGVMPFLPLPPSAPIPLPPIVELMLSTSSYGVRNVAIDSKLKEKILKNDEYSELFNFDPDIHEIRSKLRADENRDNGEFTGYLVSKNLLNSEFTQTIPKNIGRSANKKGTVRFGIELLGNNPIDNRSKRFKVKRK
tara:strand:+ start:18403 stop:19869 length:1467 start_codon:yes stop_codon:yes gene_type:complete